MTSGPKSLILFSRLLRRLLCFRLVWSWARILNGSISSCCPPTDKYRIDLSPFEFFSRLPNHTRASRHAVRMAKIKHTKLLKMEFYWPIFCSWCHSKKRMKNPSRNAFLNLLVSTDRAEFYCCALRLFTFNINSRTERKKNTSNKIKINSSYDFMNPPYECGWANDFIKHTSEPFDE